MTKGAVKRILGGILPHHFLLYQMQAWNILLFKGFGQRYLAFLYEDYCRWESYRGAQELILVWFKKKEIFTHPQIKEELKIVQEKWGKFREYEMWIRALNKGRPHQILMKDRRIGYH